MEIYLWKSFQVSLAIFAVYVLSSPDNYLDADKAFVTLSYINLFNFSLSNLPLSVNYFGQVCYIQISSVCKIVMSTSSLHNGIIQCDILFTYILMIWWKLYTLSFVGSCFCPAYHKVSQPGRNKWRLCGEKYQHER